MSDTCVNHIKNYWKILTSDAHKHFKEGNYETALDNYLNALYRAEVLNNNSLDCVRLKVPFVQLYLLSCNNLANCYQKMERINETCEMLKKSIIFLLRFSNNEKIHTEMKQKLQKTTQNFLNFTQNKNIKITDKELFVKFLNY